MKEIEIKYTDNGKSYELYYKGRIVYGAYFKSAKAAKKDAAIQVRKFSEGMLSI